MEKLVFGSIYLLSMILVCLADDVTDEELLKTLLTDPPRSKLRDIVDELLLEQETPSLDALLAVDDRQLSSGKRIFCNGAVGCLNRFRRRKPQDSVEQMSLIKKRPFCNGFFGCGNGKRSYDVPVIRDEQRQPQQKRLFCNMGGCGNGYGKRTLYSALLDRLQPVADDKSL
ncbi:conoCAP-like [Mytilus californianus]|uniref:conoCAP-like n=1 Tax=Mytilus californianus TaxID=6549 RepID=UPI002245C2AC|nr:conoCAP-like [Mytilus californianus]